MQHSHQREINQRYVCDNLHILIWYLKRTVTCSNPARKICVVVKNMWRISENIPYGGKKYNTPWTDAAHDARQLIRAYNIFRWWTSQVNVFVALCALLIKNAIAKVWTDDLGWHCFFRNIYLNDTAQNGAIFEYLN